MVKIILTGILLSAWLASQASAFSTTLSHTAVSVATSTTVTVPNNGKRNFLMIQNNDGTNPIFCKFSATAAANQGIKILANATVMFETAIPKGTVNCIATGASVVTLVTEGVTQ